MNPKFIKYEINETPMSQRGEYEPLGIATVEVTLQNGKKLHLNYIVKFGKDNKGVHVPEFSQKLNGIWKKSCEFESNFDKAEVESLIRKGIAGGEKQVEKPKEAPTPTYRQPDFMDKGDEVVPF